MLLSCFGYTRNHGSSSASDTVTYNPVIGVVRVAVQAINVKEGFLFRPQPLALVKLQGQGGALEEPQRQERRSKDGPNLSAYFLVHSLEEKLDFKVLNLNGCFRPSLIGRANFPLSIVVDDPRHTGEERPITTNFEKTKGTLLFDVLYYPVSVRKGIGPPSGIGVVTFHINMAKNIRWKDGVKMPKHLQVAVSLDWNAKPLYVTALSSSSNLPLWNSTFNSLCFDAPSTIVVFKLVERLGRKVAVYGHISLALNELVAAHEENKEWWPLLGCLDGQLKVNCEWKAIDMN